MKKTIGSVLILCVMVLCFVAFTGCGGGNKFISYKKSSVEEITVTFKPFNLSEKITDKSQIEAYYNDINGAEVTEYKHEFVSFEWKPTKKVPEDISYVLYIKNNGGDQELISFAADGYLYLSSPVKRATYAGKAPDGLKSKLDALFNPFFKYILKDGITEFKIIKRQIVSGNPQEIQYIKSDITELKAYLTPLESSAYSETTAAVNKLPSGAYTFDYDYEVRNNADGKTLFFVSGSGFYFRLAGMDHFVKLAYTVDLSNFNQ